MHPVEHHCHLSQRYANVVGPLLPDFGVALAPMDGIDHVNESLSEQHRGTPKSRVRALQVTGKISCPLILSTTLNAMQSEVHPLRSWL